MIPYILALLLVQPDVTGNEAAWEASVGPISVETTLVTHDIVRPYLDCGETETQLNLDLVSVGLFANLDAFGVRFTF